MATFKELEESVHSGEPLRIVKFAYGTASTASYRYTTSDVLVIHNGETYDPVPVEHDAVVSSPSLDKKELTISLPASAEISKLYVRYAPNTPVAVTIFQGHAGSLDYKLVWSGIVLSATFTASGCEFTLEPSTAGLKRLGLREFWQTSCIHLLYGSRCGATQSFTTMTVVSHSGYSLTISGSLSNAYKGGVIKYGAYDGQVIRTIVGVSGSLIKLNGPITGDPLTIQASMGCDHTLETCNSRFSNGENYGGFPFIPLQNPIQKNIFN